MVEGNNHDLILGSDGSGIYIIGSEQTRVIGKKDGLKSEVILRIKRSLSQDVYWIVTSNSLAYMTSDYQVTTIQRFPYPNNYDLYENSKGDIWLLASNGIYVTSTEELLANDMIDPVFYGYPKVSGTQLTTDVVDAFMRLVAKGEFRAPDDLGVELWKISTISIRLKTHKAVLQLWFT